jgi:hypothetical protein
LGSEIGYDEKTSFELAQKGVFHDTEFGLTKGPFDTNFAELAALGQRFW